MASPEEQIAAMVARLPAMTGRSLDEWKRVIASTGLTAHGKIVAMLKGLRRKTQFALLQPSASRLDVGIKLPGMPPTARLEASGSSTRW